MRTIRLRLLLIALTLAGGVLLVVMLPSCGARTGPGCVEVTSSPSRTDAEATQAHYEALPPPWGIDERFLGASEPEEGVVELRWVVQRLFGLDGLRVTPVFEAGAPAPDRTLVSTTTEGDAVHLVIRMNLERTGLTFGTAVGLRISSTEDGFTPLLFHVPLRRLILGPSRTGLTQYEYDGSVVLALVAYPRALQSSDVWHLEAGARYDFVYRIRNLSSSRQTRELLIRRDDDEEVRTVTLGPNEETDVEITLSPEGTGYCWDCVAVGLREPGSEVFRDYLGSGYFVSSP